MLLQHFDATSNTEIIDRVDANGETALQLCLVNGNIAVADLLASRASPLAIDANGRTSLHWCAASGYSSTTEALLQHESPATRMFDAEGYIPLHYAMRQNQADCVRLLLSRDPESGTISDKEGFLPLAAGAYIGCVEAVQVSTPSYYRFRDTFISVQL